ncbi:MULTISPECIES: acyltransferase [unclassified Nostoc]|uniref:acyltransferase family protein n=1 Tax=unclassified Nostoc TaxID=2593658 RepID=UPI002AD4EDC6|nr:acyltransferase [Nostoc sp. DedQUE03]MDZ7971014.1 acyltransferase [Nostoc sp. DedQUE03]MDZ8049442.1 acyltransferase [Nostoc sp. DedQUE02]
MNKKLNLLQVYRGIASILVVLTHGNIILSRELHQDDLLQIFHFGWIGVDFFFVLSGFIIFYIHQSDIGKPNKLKSFIFKRFIRVYPLYWSILTIKILVSLFNTNKDSISQRSAAEIIKAILLLPQDRSILERTFIGVSWTLSFEVFFYCIFALLIFKNTKISQSLILVWMIGIILNLLNLLPIGENFLLTFIFNERNLEFMLGCLAAYTISKYQFKFATSLIYVSIFLLVVSAINTKYKEFNVSGISPSLAYGIPFTLLIIGSVYLEISKTVNIPKILIYIGDASYSIYLTHGFFLSTTSKIFTKFTDKINLSSLIPNRNIYYNVSAFIIVLIAIAMGCVIHSYLEKPLITNLRKKVFSQRTETAK